MVKDYKRVLSLVLVLLMIFGSMPAISYALPEDGQFDKDDPFEMMVDTTPELMSVEEIIESATPLGTSEAAIELAEIELEPSDYESLEQVQEIVEDAVDDINDINDMDLELDPFLLDQILEQQQDIVEQSKMNRFIVKYKDDGKDSFREKVGDEIKESIELADINPNRSEHFYISNNFNRSLDDIYEISLDTVNLVNWNDDKTELIIVEESVNPSEFAETLRERNVEEEIEYIQPDFQFELNAVDSSLLDVMNDLKTTNELTGDQKIEKKVETGEVADTQVSDFENSLIVESQKNDSSQETPAVDFGEESTSDETPADSDISNDPVEEPIINESITDGAITTDEAITEELLIEESQENKIIVAIIDTGLDITHPELEESIYANPNEIPDNGIDDDGNGYIDDVNGWNFADNSGVVYKESLGLEQAHATHIAGIIAGKSNADEGLIPNDNIDILPLKVFSNGTAYTSDIIAAIDYAEKMGAKVINCSFGSTYENQALKEAMENGSVLFVTATGNARMNLDETPVYPAAFDLPNNLSVTSTNQDGGLSYFSSYGENSVGIAALGRDIESTLPSGERGLYTGTSMSAGIVSAAAGRIFSACSNLDANQMKEKLINGADKISSLQGKVNEAARLNFSESLAGNIQADIQNISYEEDFDVSGYESVTEALKLFTASETVKVVAGYQHSLVLQADGTVWAWGRNAVGECGTRNSSSVTETLAQVIGLSNIVNIFSKGVFSYALKSDGTVWAWGQNTYGQLGDGTTTFKPTPVQVSGLTDIVDVSAGYNHCLALKSDGTVWTWGQNTYGQLGDGTTINRLSPIQVSNLTEVTDIAAGYYHSLAIKSDGSVWAWGYNNCGQLGDGTTTTRTSPVQVNGLTDIAALSAGVSHSLARKSDGTVWAWGYNGHGELGDGTITRKLIPTQLSGITSVKAISTGSYHNFILKEDNTLWAWGYNNYGQLGDGTTTAKLVPTQLSSISNIKDISAGNSHTVALKTDGMVWAWGYNGNGQIGDNSVFKVKYPLKTSLLTEMTKVEVGFYHLLGLKTDGTVWTWGQNAYGQLGDGTTVNNTNLVQVNGLVGVTEISADSTYNLALQADGTVWSWGRNNYGQLGDGTTTNRISPVQVSGLINVKAIVAGSGHCLALKTDGTVWAWGYNNFGQLGDGTTINKSIPVKVSGLADVEKIMVGGSFSVALKSDGSLWAWGNNSKGQLGDGTTVNKTAPVMINGILDVKEIGAGTGSSYLLKNDGTVWVWGANGTGCLGDGTTVNKTTPVQLSGISSVDDIEVGGRLIIVIKTDGTVWGWGDNSMGQLGDGTFIDRSIPTQINELAEVNQIFAGYTTSFARSSEGDFGFGDNSLGKLGFPFTEYYTTPIQSWTAISDDHGDAFDTATALSNANGAVTLNGIINHVSDADIFSFTAIETASYAVSFGNTTTSSIKAILYDSTQTEIGQMQSGTNINLTQGQKYYVKVESGSIQSTFAEIPYSIQIGSTDKALAVTCTLGKDIYIPFRVNNTNNMSNKVFTLKYMVEDLDIVDLVSQTKALETISGIATGSGIEILSCTPGMITFKVDKSIPEGKTWSGVINVFKFKAKITGETTVTVEYN